MTEARIANPLVEQFRKGGVPRDLRLMAAQGALPLKPADLRRAAALPARGTPTRDVASDTREGHAGRDARADELLPILQGPGDAARRAGLGGREPHRAELREAALQNLSTPDEAIEAAGRRRCPRSWPSWSSSTRSACCAAPRCWRRSRANPDLNNDQKRRLRELRETLPHRRGAGAAPPPPPPPPAAEPRRPRRRTRRRWSRHRVRLTEEEAVVRYLHAKRSATRPRSVNAVQKHLPAEHRREGHHGPQGHRARSARSWCATPTGWCAAAVLGSPTPHRAPRSSPSRP